MPETTPSVIEASEHGAPFHPLDVLVIDDDPELRALLTITLRRRGFSVFETDDLLLAADLVARKLVRAVVLDLMIGDIDGANFLTSIRMDHSPAALPVIMLTNSRQRVDLLRCLQAGANDLINKPVDIEILVAKIAVATGVSDRFNELEKQVNTDSVRARAPL